MAKINNKRSIATIFAIQSSNGSKKSKYKITKNEIRTRVGYILLGLFVANLVGPIQGWVDNLGLNVFVISIIGLIITLYFFDF